jgi:hypothetical protein
MKKLILHTEFICIVENYISIVSTLMVDVPPFAWFLRGIALKTSLFQVWSKIIKWSHFCSKLPPVWAVWISLRMAKSLPFTVIKADIADLTAVHIQSTVSAIFNVHVWITLRKKFTSINCHKHMSKLWWSMYGKLTKL